MTGDADLSWYSRGGFTRERAVYDVVVAVAGGDRKRWERMLHPDVRLTVDAGGVVPAPDQPLCGAPDVSAYLWGVLAEPETDPRVTSVNGMPGLVVRRQGEVTAVLSLDVRDGLVVEGWLVVNPEKLRTWSAGSQA